MPKTLQYQPRGSWGAFLDLDRSQIQQIRASEESAPGEPWKPDLVKRLPSYPNKRLVEFDFYRPTLPDGSPRPFMRAGSPIDEKSGIYFIWSPKTRSIYVGSSIGTSRQGNLRRTLARHWQSWDRSRKLSEYVTRFAHKAPMKDPSPTKGGVTYDRSKIYVCILPVENDDPRFVKPGSKEKAPRILEAWYYLHFCQALRCDGTNQLALVMRDQPDEPFDLF